MFLMDKQQFDIIKIHVSILFISKDKTIDFSTKCFLRDFFNPDRILLDQPLKFKPDGTIENGEAILNALERARRKTTAGPAKIVTFPKRGR